MSRRPRASRTRRLFLTALVVLAAAVVWSMAVPAGTGGTRLVKVQPGQPVSAVGLMLADEGVIRSPQAFIATAYLTGKWRRIQAGRHDLAPSMTGFEILDALCRGSRAAWRWLTIPEGYTERQIAAAVETAGVGKADEFAAAAATPFDSAQGRPQELEIRFPLPGTGLEGYLFPDTYRVGSGETAEDLVAQMLGRFGQVVWRGLFREQPTYKGRTLNEVIILASLVEGEAKREKDRPLIAGVLMNRLNRGQRLECDATVQYALGDGRKPRLAADDLNVQSDYNTYLHPGLPPGPICNPGEASIRAAMEPANVPYLYYVARPDGSHVFSRTFEEHQAAVARVRAGAGGGSR
jgi:UPF0755 protein